MEKEEESEKKIIGGESETDILENKTSSVPPEEVSEPSEEETKEDSPKDTKKLLILIGIVVGCFALFFLIRFVYSPTGGAVTIDELHKQNLEGKTSDINYLYNGFSFVYVNGLWYTQVQGENTLFDIPLHFGPKELEEILVIGGVDNSFRKNEVYITFNPLSQDMQYIALSSAELSLNLVKGLGIIPVAACIKNETDACKDRPIITCDSGEAAIFIKRANQTMVRLDGNCVILQGKGWGLVKATDRFLLKWYGIMG